MWSSKEADRQGGNNITGFKNDQVDKLIEEQKKIFSVAQRHEICRTIDKIVFDQHPYVLLWNINYTRLLYWNKFGTPQTVLGKYSRESIYYWWFDEDLNAELTQAMQKDQALPKPPEVIDYDKLMEAE